jgi:hypothetical protein
MHTAYTLMHLPRDQRPIIEFHSVYFTLMIIALGGYGNRERQLKIGHLATFLNDFAHGYMRRYQWTATSRAIRRTRTK